MGLLGRLAVVLLFCFLTGCATVPEEIADIRLLKQDATVYLFPSTSHIPLISSADQAVINDNFDETYFSPWHLAAPRYGKDDITRKFDKYRDNMGYGENKLAHTQSWFDALYANAVIDSFPNADLPAITVVNSDLRLLPTSKPLFHDFDLPGEGYPFDYLQNSRIPVNTPVKIIHISRDRDWLFVDSPIAMGWVAAGHLALVGGAFQKDWERGRYSIAVKDDVPVYDSQGSCLFRTSMGAQFPRIDQEDLETHRILVAVRDRNGRAVIKEVVVSKHDFSEKPVVPNPANIAGLINEMIGQPYGWGGMYGNRDCSATLKDLFAPFGLWLPRNSKRQAHDVGELIDLTPFDSTEKEKVILEKGVPFATLIWRPGHIMLYLGSHQGRPVVFHNLWGLLTRNWYGKEGRKIIGHAAITTLSPGKELGNTRRERDLLNTAAGMTVLFPE